MSNNCLNFKTNTLLKNLIGKDLINDDDIAIIELVKNSHDANAKKITLSFDRVDSEGGIAKIIIADNGSGMNLADLKDKWFNIAHSEKAVTNRKKGVYYAGNKGVGRFSCDRLGSKLDLVTRKSGDKILHVQLDWTAFEVENDKDLTIQDIKVYYRVIKDDESLKITGLKLKKSGTILVISQLRSTWDRPRLMALRVSLEKFINPNQIFQKSGFGIYLNSSKYIDSDKECEERRRVNGVIENTIFEKLKFNATYIEAVISKDGTTILFELFHDGEPVFKYRDVNRLYPLLKGVKIILYYLNPYKKSYFKRQTGVRLVEFGSIFLFLNGFRVSPYGDRGNDWLGLDVRKTQGQNRYLSSRELVGRIELIGASEEFKPVSSREGMKATPSFDQLTENFFMDVLKKIEHFVIKGLGWDSVPEDVRLELSGSGGSADWRNTKEIYVESNEKKRNRIALSITSMMGLSQKEPLELWFNPSLLDEVSGQRSEEVRSILGTFDNFDGGVVDENLKKNLKKIKEVIDAKDEDLKSANEEVLGLKVESAKNKESIKGLRKSKESYEAQTLFLKSVTSLDIRDSINFHHGIVNETIILERFVANAMRKLRNGDSIEGIIKCLKDVSRVNKRIQTRAQMASRANFKNGIKKELTDLPAYFEQYIKNVSPDFSGQGVVITIVNNVKSAFEVKVRKIEMSMLVDNIISNSKKAGADNIEVTMSRKGENTLIVSFVDDGVGLDESINLKDVFEPGVTSTRGSGLGLPHVREIVQAMDSTVEFLPCKNKGVQVRLVLLK